MCHTFPSVADFELCKPEKKNSLLLKTLVPRPTSHRKWVGEPVYLRARWEHSEHTLGTPWTHSESTLLALWPWSGKTLGALWPHSRNTLGAFWAFSGNTLDTLWTRSGITLGALRMHSGSNLRWWTVVKVQTKKWSRKRVVRFQTFVKRKSNN